MITGKNRKTKYGQRNTRQRETDCDNLCDFTIKWLQVDREQGHIWLPHFSPFFLFYLMFFYLFQWPYNFGAVLLLQWGIMFSFNYYLYYPWTSSGGVDPAVVVFRIYATVTFLRTRITGMALRYTAHQLVNLQLGAEGRIPMKSAGILVFCDRIATYVTPLCAVLSIHQLLPLLFSIKLKVCFALAYISRN